MIFIIEPYFIERINELVEFAELNPLYLDDILDMVNGSRPIAGDTKGYYIVDPIGTKIVYTIEIMPEYKLRHFSISIANGTRLPHPIIVNEIIKLFGFKSDLSECIVEIEKRGDNPKVGILNVAEKIID